MTPEEIAALPPVKPEPVRTCVSAVCLLSRRMLGSLDRRSFLESVQAARALHARADGQRAAAAGGANRCRAQIFLRLLLSCWRAGQPASARAAARRTTRQPSAWGSRQPPAARHTRCAGNGLAALSLRRYVSTLLCRYVAMSLRCYVATPLCRYAAMSLSVFAATSLCREVCTRVCDGRALRMCVMAVQRCTGVVGTCVARPRPQSAFANG